VFEKYFLKSTLLIRPYTTGCARCPEVSTSNVSCLPTLKPSSHRHARPYIGSWRLNCATSQPPGISFSTRIRAQFNQQIYFFWLFKSRIHKLLNINTQLKLSYHLIKIFFNHLWNIRFYTKFSFYTKQN
jgi:hypothetical protein